MEREALRKINLIFGERIMKDGNAGNDVEFAGGNMPVIAHGGNMPVIAHGGNMPVIAHGANMPVIAHGANVPSTITIIPGNTVTFSQGITSPVIITNGIGITLNVQSLLVPSTITSFEDHLEVQPLGHVVSNDTVSDL